MDVEERELCCGVRRASGVIIPKDEEREWFETQLKQDVRW
jgi:hypothetical protein